MKIKMKTLLENKSKNDTKFDFNSLLKSFVVFIEYNFESNWAEQVQELAELGHECTSLRLYFHFFFFVLNFLILTFLQKIL